MIRVALADPQEIFCYGIHAILSNVTDIDFVNHVNCQHMFMSLCKKTWPDVALVAEKIVQDNPEFLKTVHQFFSKTKILILLHREDSVDFNWLMRFDVTGIIHKNDTSEQLVTAIHSVYKGQRWLSPSLIETYYQQTTIQPNANLTERELSILQLVVAEHTDKQIALTLHISERTVRTHLQRIYIKLDVNTRVGAAVQATRLDLLRNGYLAPHLPEPAKKCAAINDVQRKMVFYSFAVLTQSLSTQERKR